jgi:hypothetical protein
MGELRVARVEESCQAAFPPEVMFPELPAAALQRQLPWLAPNYYDPQGPFGRQHPQLGGANSPPHDPD